MHITVCYLTSRKLSRVEWFFASLANQVRDWTDVSLIVVDRWAEARPDWTAQQAASRISQFDTYRRGVSLDLPLRHLPPKPTPWAGAHRLTKRDHFAASNARNTGLCLAPDGYIVYVDDLSVLLPGWWQSVLDAAAGGYIACGVFRKVMNLDVSAGYVSSFTDYPGGRDTRLTNIVPYSDPVDCLGEWLYGCSLALPTEALLRVNGWDEDCDGMGFEDCITGWILHHHGGAKLKLCPRMITWESEEGHSAGAPEERVGKGAAKPYKGYPDCVHAILDWAKSGSRTSSSNNTDMRQLRSEALSGKPFPVLHTASTTHWPDGQPISEM